MREALLQVNGSTQINGGQFTVINNYSVSRSPKAAVSGFDLLHAQAAITALHDALDSFGSGRCHPKTRQTVLNEMLNFIQDDPKTRKNWIMWLSGPAGSGKTTIARTLAYLCDHKGLNQTSFFFCRLDLTRSSVKPLVATLAYQIACRFPSVRDIIIAEVEGYPHIFQLALEAQFRRLIIVPLKDGQWRKDLVGDVQHPLVCVIDALDECEGDRALEVQSKLVQTLHELVNEQGCPVVFMIASRPEANLRMTFNRFRNSIARVYLDNTYEPSIDIRRFVNDKFEEIRTIHPLASSLPHDWPKPSVIEAIVAKSSGQFIYAAIVMRQISSPSSHPATSLENILDAFSKKQSTVPFAELDNIFTFILARAIELPAILTVVSCHLLTRKLSDLWFSLLIELHGHTINSIRNCMIDITSLIEINDEKQRLVIHHESLVDFLVDRRRAGRFYVDVGRTSYDSLMTVLRKRTRNDVHLVVDYIIALLPKVSAYSEEMNTLLFEFSREAVTIHPECFLTDYGKRVLLNAFANPHIDLQDKTIYKKIWQKWSVPSKLSNSRSLSLPSRSRGSPRGTGTPPQRGSQRGTGTPPRRGSQRGGGPPPLGVGPPLQVADPPSQGGVPLLRAGGPPRRGRGPPMGRGGPGRRSAEGGGLASGSTEDEGLAIGSTEGGDLARGSAEGGTINSGFAGGGGSDVFPRLIPLPKFEGPITRYVHELSDVERHDIERIVASALLSGATSIPFSTFTDLLDLSPVNCAKVFSLPPITLEYSSKDRTILPRPGWHATFAPLWRRCLDLENFKVQTIILMVSSCDSYKGNLFGDLSALLFIIDTPTFNLTSWLKLFATLLTSSQVDVHVLDFTTFLDGLAHVYFYKAKGGTETLLSNSHNETEGYPEYIEILTGFVRFWASRHYQLDPQLLTIPAIIDVWQKIV